MNVHKNARLTPLGRERIVRQVRERADAEGRRRSRRRLPADGSQVGRSVSSRRLAGLRDRSSRPHRLHRPTPQARCRAGRGATPSAPHRQADRCRVATSRRQPSVASSSAWGSTGSAPWNRPSRCAATNAPEPGEMIHIDIKKLGRIERAGHRITGDRQGCRNAGAGWEYVHVAIDDHSRIAFAKVMPNEKKRSAIAFLKAALAYYESLGRQSRARHDRQWLLLQVIRFPQGVQAARTPAHQDQALHAKDQRKGRALHPDLPARVGLRASLSTLTSAKGRIAILAAQLQLAQTPRRNR